MAEKRTAIYTIEIDGAKYKTLPIWKTPGSRLDNGSIQESAEILLATLGIPDELTKANIDLWRQGNYFALVSWVGHLLPEGTSQLYSISDPTQNPITWTIKSQIRGI